MPVVRDPVASRAMDRCQRTVNYLAAAHIEPRWPSEAVFHVSRMLTAPARPHNPQS